MLADGGAVSGTIPAERRNVYLEFATNSYTIAYKGNGSDGGSAPASHTGVYYDDPMSKGFTTSVTTKANTFTKTGYTFSKWNTKADGTGTDITAGSGTVSAKTLVDLVTDPGNGGTVYLYAKWNVNSYTLTFALDGGSLTAGGGFSAGTSNQSKTVTYARTYGAADSNSKTWPNDPTKTGYTFAGWKSGSTTFTSGGTVSITSNTTVTASWTANEYTLNFNENGGTWADSTVKWNSDGTAASNYTTSKAKYVHYNSTYGATDKNNKKWPIAPTKTGFGPLR